MYVVRADDRNEELRYSLRSLRNLGDARRVWIVGHRPAWVVNVRHIPVPQGPKKFANVKAALAEIAASRSISSPFAYFNDDFFVMQPMDTLPVLHRGPLANIAGPATPNTRAMAEVLRLLTDHSIADPLCYDLHAPLPVTRKGLALALSIATGLHLPERTLYGNLAGIGGELAHNFKVYDSHQTGWEDWPFLSTIDSGFKSLAVGAHIRSRFPDPSEYEQ